MEQKNTNTNIALHFSVLCGILVKFYAWVHFEKAIKRALNLTEVHWGFKIGSYKDYSE